MAELETLRAENADLRGRLARAEGVDLAFRLMARGVAEPLCCRVLAALRSRTEGCSKSQLMDVLYGDRPDGGAQPKIVDVCVAKLRARHAELRTGIKTVWAHGYVLTSGARDWVDRAAVFADPVLPPTDPDADTERRTPEPMRRAARVVGRDAA